MIDKIFLLIVVLQLVLPVLSQGICLREGFPKLDPKRQDIQVDLPPLQHSFTSSQSSYSEASVNYSTASSWKYVSSATPSALTSSAIQSSVANPSATTSSAIILSGPRRSINPTLRHSLDTITVSPSRRWEALENPSFAQRYITQEFNEWAFRIGRNVSVPLSPCGFGSRVPDWVHSYINEPLHSQGILKYPPLLAWARLREGTIPALPQEILYTIQQRSTEIFGVHYILPPALLDEILRTIPVIHAADYWEERKALERYVFRAEEYIRVPDDFRAWPVLRRPPQQLLNILNDPSNGAGVSIDLAWTQMRALVLFSTFPRPKE